MRAKIESAFDWLDLLCVRYFPRIAEGGLSLMLIGLAAYIIDERVALAGLVQALPFTPLWGFAALLASTSCAHMLGIFMPLVHEWLARLGCKRELLTRPMFDELRWRRWCCLLAVAEWAAYAGVVSRIRWTAWLFAVPYCLLMSVAFIRLGVYMDARARTTNADTAIDPGCGERDGHGDGSVAFVSSQREMEIAPARIL